MLMSLLLNCSGLLTGRELLIPYQFTNDTDLVVLAQQGAKTATCIAELACEAAQKHGVTESSLDDHTLQKKIEAC